MSFKFQLAHTNQQTKKKKVSCPWYCQNLDTCNEIYELQTTPFFSASIHHRSGRTHKKKKSRKKSCEARDHYGAAAKNPIVFLYLNVVLNSVYHVVFVYIFLKIWQIKMSLERGAHLSESLLSLSYCVTRLKTIPLHPPHAPVQLLFWIRCLLFRKHSMIPLLFSNIPPPSSNNFDSSSP